MPEPTSPLVGILMGSDSDWPKIQAAGAALDLLGPEFSILPAHKAMLRNPP